MTLLVSFSIVSAIGSQQVVCWNACKNLEYVYDNNMVYKYSMAHCYADSLPVVMNTGDPTKVCKQKNELVARYDDEGMGKCSNTAVQPQEGQPIGTAFNQTVFWHKLCDVHDNPTPPGP